MVLTAYHTIRDHAKLSELTASMCEHGWQGIPLVVISDDPNDLYCGQLLTGTHRIVAAKAAGLDTSEDVPIITLASLFDEVGLDYEDVLAEYQPASDSDYREMAVRTLPADLLARYGIEETW